MIITNGAQTLDINDENHISAFLAAGFKPVEKSPAAVAEVKEESEKKKPAKSKALSK